MYKCKKCGNLFENVGKSIFDIGYDPDYDGCAPSCPDCGSDDYIEVKPCKICGEYVGSSAHFGLCEKCEKETEKIVGERLTAMCSELEECEIAVLEEMLNNLELTSLLRKIERERKEE